MFTTKFNASDVITDLYGASEASNISVSNMSVLNKTINSSKFSMWCYSRTTIYSPLRKNMGKLVCDCLSPSM